VEKTFCLKSFLFIAIIYTHTTIVNIIFIIVNVIYILVYFYHDVGILNKEIRESLKI